MSLTQYLESQEDHDMTRLLYFTKTQEKRREGGGVVCFGMEEGTLDGGPEGGGKEKLGEGE